MAGDSAEQRPPTTTGDTGGATSPQDREATRVSPKGGATSALPGETVRLPLTGDEGQGVTPPPYAQGATPPLPASATPRHARIDPSFLPEVDNAATPIGKAGIGDVQVNLPNAGEVPGEGKSRGRHRPVLAAVLVLVLVVAAGAFVSYQAELWGGKSVPNLIGSTEQEATEALEAKGLKAEFQEQTGDDTSGLVLATSPAAGTRVDEGSTVVVTISAKRTIPEVVGLTETEARALLEEAGARDITSVEQISDAEEGTVLAVDPDQGAEFTSNDRITLTVAKALTVPKVVGLTEREAKDALSKEGLTAEVTYVSSDEEQGTVVSCSPEEGTRVSAGSKVELSVASPYPSEWNHVSEYFGHNSATIATYLAEQGFTLSGSYLGDDGYACALYSASDKGNLLFTSAPWTNSFDQSKAKEGVDVLSDGTQFMGLRLEIAGGSAPATEDGVKDVMESCGLSNMQGICSQYGITVPPTTKKGDQVFACAYGQMGNCYWTVLVEAQGSGSREVVTCASTSCYSSSELAAYGGRVCDYVAALDVYGTATTGQDSGQSAEQSTGQN